MFVSVYTIRINSNNNCSSMLNVGSCARFFSCGWVKFCMVCFQVWVYHVMQGWKQFWNTTTRGSQNLGIRRKIFLFYVMHGWKRFWNTTTTGSQNLALGKNILILIGPNIIKALQGGTRS